MRYVPIETFAPSEGWQERAEEATKSLFELKNHDERIEFLKANSQIWRDLREELIAKFGGKCWFTDAPEIIAHLDVEHFRPKAKAVNLDFTKMKLVNRASELPQTSREGYWWLAFDASNLKLCGQIPNRQFKGSFFPLHATSKVAEPNAVPWRDESCVFLDPTDFDDVLLVWYAEDGSVRPRGDATEWQKLRVIITNDLFGLSDHQPLLEARQKVWQKCAGLIQQVAQVVKEEAGVGPPSPTLKERKKQFLERLRAMTDPNEPFASVAASCLLQSPFEFARTLAAQQHEHR